MTVVSTGTLLYFGMGTLLFFFWAYGIYAFVRDCRRTYIPGLRRLLARRREQTDERDREQERDEKEKQLY
ncbi:hypothetical protein [Halosimplex salinum]|uniref:hypothetical protein n=1 Tax=Halosimplex salinum TaxID=1710538 RepID=UPI000F48C4B7|nr:hypothetical protein [Halosimplex salinum]